jgi:hypothetical protein
MALDPRMWALRRKQNHRQRLLLNDFIQEHPNLDPELDNWTPEEDRAWREFTADFDIRCSAERHALAVELGLRADEDDKKERGWIRDELS